MAAGGTAAMDTLAVSLEKRDARARTIAEHIERIARGAPPLHMIAT